MAEHQQTVADIIGTEFSTDFAPLSPDHPSGTLESLCLSARSLVDTITIMKSWLQGDQGAQVLLSRFNTDLRIIRDLPAEYENAVAALYPITGLEIDGRIGICGAAIARDIGRWLYWSILPKSGPDRVTLALDAIRDGIPDFVPINCRATVSRWPDLRPDFDAISDSTLRRIETTLRREQMAITEVADQPKVANVRADTPKINEILSRMECQTTALLVSQYLNGNSDGADRGAINAEFRRANAQKLGKTDDERDAAFYKMKSNARRKVREITGADEARTKRGRTA
ncbi:MAG: hypothetical protein SH850_24035 [Planctomycetaceae bacterium]|nr:hypothetical protein [Planctomycetaceae bacterium]